MPVSVVREDEQFYDGGAHKDSITDAAKAAMRGSAGLPVAVQVITQPWRDEACLGAMRVLEEALGRVDLMPAGPMALPRP